MRLWSKTGLNVACRITVLRILGVPLFVVLVYYYTSGIKLGSPNEYLRWTALLVFSAVALTDALDGYVARSRDQVTRLGRILDPIADKTLLLAGLIALTRPSLPSLQPQIPEWFTILIISRDVVLVSGAIIIHAAAGHITIQPRIGGKASTFFILLAIFLVLLGSPHKLFISVVAMASFCTLISFFQYVADGLHQLGKAPE